MDIRQNGQPHSYTLTSKRSLGFRLSGDSYSELPLLTRLNMSRNFARNDFDCIFHVLKLLENPLQIITILSFGPTGKQLFDPSTKRTVLRCVVYFLHTLIG